MFEDTTRFGLILLLTFLFMKKEELSIVYTETRLLFKSSPYFDYLRKKKIKNYVIKNKIIVQRNEDYIGQTSMAP